MRATNGSGDSSYTSDANATTGEAVFYIYPDQLGTPRLIQDGSANTVWTWANDDPFGNNPPNENPSSLGTFTFNPRFPGQYADKETNLAYNWYRDYDPSRGRYAESDPIGLDGGINTYTYGLNNPLSYTDTEGLLGRPSGAVGGKGVPKPPMSRYEKCMFKCDMVFGNACKPAAFRVPGAWGKIGTYIVCNVAIYEICKQACSHNGENRCADGEDK